MDTKVKICGITNLEDALCAAEAGAYALGLMFYEKSPRYLSVEVAAEISRQLPKSVLRVGVFVDAASEFVDRALKDCSLDLLQFHGSESPDFCQKYGEKSIKAFRVKDSSSLAALSEFPVSTYLLDSYVPGVSGGTGETFNWDLAVAAHRYGKPFFLAGGLTVHNVAQAVREVQPFGVDISSGVEASPGKKDHAKIIKFINEVRRASQA